MKIAIIGFGKMGKMVKNVAEDLGHQIVATMTRDIHLDSLKKADVCIEFTHPDSVLANIEKLAKLKKPIVVGTTGWYHQIKEVEKIVNKNKIGLIYSPNFSIGVHIFHNIVAQAAQMIHHFDYDVGGIEMHHNQKADSPSGTAKTLAQTILDHFPSKKKMVTNCEGKRNPTDMHMTSLRCGSVPGTHSIYFDSTADTITLTHTARNREGFSRGAVHAAEWILNKKGIFTLNDMMGDL